MVQEQRLRVMPSSSPSNSRVPSLINGQFEMHKRLGAGCFGEVYRGINLKDKDRHEVAVKFEGMDLSTRQLEQEAAMLNLLKLPVLPQGFAEFFYYGQEESFNCLVMEALGKNLEDNLVACNGKFTPSTAGLVAEQILVRLEYLHSKGFVHRDIKPENFMWGVRSKVHHLYMIDFGLSKRYWDMNHKRHVHQGQKQSLTGTARYASINAHCGVEQSRRDDLEAVGHMLLYFLRGKLPWSGLEAKTKKEKYEKIKKKKESTDLSALCAGFPDAFETYLRYARELGFKDRPDYVYLRKLFSDMRVRREQEEGKKIEEWDFDWFQGKKLDGPEPLLPYESIVQPDDVSVQAPSRRRGMCCLCGGVQVAD